MQARRAPHRRLRADPVTRSAQVHAGHPFPARALSEQLGRGPFSLVTLFVSPDVNLDLLLERMKRSFGDTPVIGCTTSGEIRDGYADGTIVALGLTKDHFATETVLIDDLGRLDPQTLIRELSRSRQRLSDSHPNWQYEFAFLLVDGLSLKEDELAALLSAGLGPVPLFGGSAGDGTRFQSTWLFHKERKLNNAALLTFVRTDCPIRVFNFDHLVPSAQRMVVTEADPDRRIVRQINAEPAAREYARLLGRDPDQLSRFTFAAHPVVVRIGDRHHVRAIQQVDANGDLVFFSAIDEGVVLTLAEPRDMVEHLSSSLDGLTGPSGKPQTILAFDCILRKLEAEQKQMVGQISNLLQQHQVVGFSTYGEQYGAMHVNQTITGVAIYPPGS
ncbi:FIST N-terminal domain-containing protein [Tabrizicola sp.]|uniref:FIST N-terminal domain-containing protein n=1 Tax=Tabrizicola sp. TaxID=2005166 RepID=UPI003F395961